MMDHMRGPEQPALVADAVEPVVGKVIGEKEQKPGPPLIADFEDCEAMDGSEHSKSYCLGGNSDEDIADAHCQTGSRVLDVVQLATHHGIADYLHDQQNQEGGNCELNQIRHVPETIADSVVEFTQISPLISTQPTRKLLTINAMALSAVRQPEDQSSENIGVQLTLLCAAQRQAFLQEGFPDYRKRLGNLNRLFDLTLANERRIADAISQDFGHRSRFETALTEVFLIIAGIKHARRHLKRWMKPRRVPTPI